MRPVTATLSLLFAFSALTSACTNQAEGEAERYAEAAQSLPAEPKGGAVHPADTAEEAEVNENETAVDTGQTAANQQSCSERRRAFSQTAAWREFASGSRIVGGEDALPGSAPWQVEIFLDPRLTQEDNEYDQTLALDDPCKYFLNERQPYELAHLCGGSYIGNGWVLTAAHCIPDFDIDRGSAVSKLPYALSIRMGTQNLTSGGEVYSVRSIVVHSDYRRSTARQNDIALIQLEERGQTERLLTQGRLEAVPLVKASDRDFDEDEDLLVTGWGFTGVRESGTNTNMDSEGDLQRSPPQLQQVSINYLADSECSVIYGNAYGSGSLCAGALQGGKGSCQGDSGGPLTREEDAGERVLVGIVSLGEGCANGTPVVFTRVSSYENWIASAMRDGVVPGQAVRFAPTPDATGD